VKIGFLINPIAGMGGRVGLKGTDGVLAEAVAQGATAVAEDRALQTLAALKSALDNDRSPATIEWVTCPDEMGANALTAELFTGEEVVSIERGLYGAERTIAAVTKMLEAKIELLLFCGGDGTARDISSVVKSKVPILGIPAGVKMFSGVFATTPQRCALIVMRFVKGEIGTVAADILDLDEERYRNGEFVVSLRDSAQVPSEPTYTQTSKSLISAADDESVKHDIAMYLRELMNARTGALFLLGPGSTVQALAKVLGIKKTLLGIDAVVDGAVVSHDLNEQQILSMLTRFEPGALILSPIGAQGFVLGRGNQQISHPVVRAFGARKIWIIATLAKLDVTEILRFDTGDPALDAELCSSNFWSVLTGYRRRRAVPVKN